MIRSRVCSCCLSNKPRATDKPCNKISPYLSNGQRLHVCYATSSNFFCVSLTSDRSQKSRHRKIEDTDSILLEKFQGSWHYSCVNNFFVFLTGDLNPRVWKLDEELPAVLSHVSLALQEHKLNFQQWSSTVLFSYFESIFLIFIEPWLICQGY